MIEKFRLWLRGLLLGEFFQKFLVAIMVLGLAALVLVVVMIFMINFVQGVLLVVFITAMVVTCYLSTVLVDWLRRPPGKE